MRKKDWDKLKRENPHLQYMEWQRRIERGEKEKNIQHKNIVKNENFKNEEIKSFWSRLLYILFYIIFYEILNKIPLILQKI